MLHFPVDLVACSYIGVPGTNTEFFGCSISCLFFANHRLVLIALSFQRPHSCYGVLVSRFQRVERKSLACIAFCSDSLILTDLRVLVHRRTSVAENAIVLSLPSHKLSFAVVTVVLSSYLECSLWCICMDLGVRGDSGRAEDISSSYTKPNTKSMA